MQKKHADDSLVATLLSFQENIIDRNNFISGSAQPRDRSREER